VSSAVNVFWVAGIARAATPAVKTATLWSESRRIHAIACWSGGSPASQNVPVLAPAVPAARNRADSLVMIVPSLKDGRPARMALKTAAGGARWCQMVPRP
jgi:hypothetical protein